MPTVSLSTVVPADADLVWSAVTSPAGFRFVSRGLVRWPVVAHRMERWREGETVVGWMFLLGFLPMSRHSLTFERLDPETREFATDEHGGPIRAWNHRITVTPSPTLGLPRAGPGLRIPRRLVARVQVKLG